MHENIYSVMLFRTSILAKIAHLFDKNIHVIKTFAILMFNSIFDKTWLVVLFLVIHVIYLHLFFRVVSLALGQSYDCPSASEATLKDMGKHNLYQSQQNTCIILEVNYFQWMSHELL